MKTSKEVLSSMLKTVQMGQVGIRSVLDTGMEPKLRQALMDQLEEYDALETEAHCLAGQRGWEVRELDPAIRFMADMTTRMKLSGRDSGSRIAAMMIQGNTRGMIKGLKNIHRHAGDDPALQTLSQKLLDCESANIRQMQPFV